MSASHLKALHRDSVDRFPVLGVDSHANQDGLKDGGVQGELESLGKRHERKRTKRNCRVCVCLCVFIIPNPLACMIPGMEADLS